MSEKKAKKIADVKEVIVSAALDLAAERGWPYVGLQDIAKACDLSLEALYDVIDHKDDILTLFGRMIDKKMLGAIGENTDVSSVSPRERIFDVLMERYDILNEHRAGLKAIIQSFKCDPKQAVFSVPQIGRSMSWVLESAGIETSGIVGALKVAGLTGIYLKGLHAWMDDESTDLSKTMAALDRALGHGEAVVNSIGL